MGILAVGLGRCLFWCTVALIVLFYTCFVCCVTFVLIIVIVGCGYYCYLVCELPCV